MPSCPPTGVALLLALAAGAAGSPVVLKTMEFGTGPAIVFVHDLGARGTTWLPVARKLAGGHRAVLVELPGHGDSPMPDPFSLAAAAEALDQVVARQAPAPTLVVGHGLGGLVALYHARAHPERVKGVVLVESGARGMNVPDQQKKMFMDFVDQQYEVFLRATFAGLARDSAQRVAVHAQASQVPPAAVKAYLRELLNVDPSQTAKGVTAPVLFLGSDKRWPADKAWPEFAKEHGLDVIPKIVARRVADSGHFMMMDQPDTLAARLADFIRETLGPR